MAKCNSCSAPLLANTNLCQYCNVRNDIDLHSKHAFSVQTNQKDRVCPHCTTHLKTIKIDIKGAFYIERCNRCFGLFFDLGEIDFFLENSVTNVSTINLDLIKNINKDRYQANKTVKYIKCPVCSSFMKRVNFGHRSGVIVDQCRKHGIWVDNGEVSHLLEWKKAGGTLLDYQEKENNRTILSSNTTNHADYTTQKNHTESDLVETVSSLIYHFFT